MSRNDRHYRQITACVMRWYNGLEGGLLHSELANVLFDIRFVNYRIDVEMALASQTPAQQAVIRYVHCDGLTHADALRAAGVVHDRPDAYVAHTEASLGRVLERRQLNDLLGYLQGCTLCTRRRG